MFKLYLTVFALAVPLASCGFSQATAPEIAPPAAVAAEAPPVVETDFLTLGKQQGYEAALAAQGATENQWRSVSQQWNTAINSLSQVPADHPDYAEAQAKIAEYTANFEVARNHSQAYEAKLAQARAEVRQAPMQNFAAELRRIDPSGQLVTRVAPDRFMTDCDTCIDITVSSGFLGLNKATRQEVATQLWTIWVRYSGVTDADKARIRLITQSGKKVGGSGMMGGSMIYVDD
ncbi:hypothetical protein GFS31_08260 [Leptolyngbya sp. BL0902]|uniref:hypothetical protein n=1 Tax=Leptolyngbya sp. BL0902 TaxID=1115757 RepID=UPI0018E864D8|nr:hypothetical protein [Leptolyngbya sp. BL0902]QQE64147.1 hypothetical protein GFS31_08260 [Leptolyngbya sp. BL0902]